VAGEEEEEEEENKQCSTTKTLFYICGDEMV
jgi:hypothetical protein